MVRLSASTAALANLETMPPGLPPNIARMSFERLA
jgi:hypothetical protein